MVKGQVFCRGSIALHEKKPVLVLRPYDADCIVVVRLIGDKPPYHRSDVDLGMSAFLLRNRVARVCNIFRVPQKSLRCMGDVAMRVPEEVVRRVEAAERDERARRGGENFRPGILRSGWRGPKMGDCGRKIGGPPSD
ncbi:hypothetical protein AtDm6_3147 [Acetobacter tropicalis]|uniref:Uncharacterized protein n=2 Tax=Acetobacter tropicalis TaxID=104102 RepID=A0A094YII1_9PROT|nr:hypothetical protein [Acetobacter tropicalis]KGB21152.1 hypothetical protein AtDm6_3147 [Acetobacter tropicalis]MDO8171948.1 hypothetical protein [Acetobacter tropicalis]